MGVACYQLASVPGTIRVWIGAHGITSAPAVDGWRLDGAPVADASLTAIRAMESVRDGTLRAGNPGRAFTGVYEIAGVTGPRRLGVTVGGTPIECPVRALPARLELGGPPLTVLLASCYHYSTDGGGRYGTLLPRIVRGATPPDLCVFMGDQVYLDLPTLKNFRDDPVWLADQFERDYVRNWFSGAFGQGLGLGPAAFIPDDHEYWNNFPQASPFIQNSWSDAGQRSWREAARALYRGFQFHGAGTLGEPLRLDVEPLSFLLLDSRSERDADLDRRLLSPAASDRLAEWAKDVAETKGLIAGVLVSGQSLLEDPVGGVKGSIADYALADYAGAYAELIEALTRVVDHGKQVLLLTGDVHWGRVSAVRDRRRDTVAIHEIISSPASLVATVGADQVADVVGAAKRFFGARDPWPRHSEAAPPPSHLPHSAQRFRVSQLDQHVGNQFLIMQMARRGTGVDVEYTFHPLAGPDRDNVSATTGRIELRRTS
jgi:hypothetical protein